MILQELTSVALLNYRPDVPVYLAERFDLNLVTTSHDSKQSVTWHTRLPINMQHDYIMTTEDLRVCGFQA